MIVGKCYMEKLTRYSVLQRILLISAALIAGYFGYWMQQSNKQTVVLLDEESVTLSSLKQDWLVVNYFAEWCRPCLKELPALAALNNQKTRLPLRVLTVNFDEEPETTLRRIREKYGAHAPIVLSYDVIATLAPRPRQLPVTYLFSPGGELHRTLWGEQSIDSILSAMDSES